MNLVRFDPWSVFDQMQRELGRTPLASDARSGESGSVTDWAPAVDIVEHKDRFVVRADLPGVEPAAIDVSMDNGILSIAGERSTADESEVDGVRRYERISGRFLRRFTLPDTADAEHITAKCANGILEVSIPKLPEVRARRITVDAA